MNLVELSEVLETIVEAHLNHDLDKAGLIVTAVVHGPNPSADLFLLSCGWSAMVASGVERPVTMAAFAEAGTKRETVDALDAAASFAAAVGNQDHEGADVLWATLDLGQQTLVAVTLAALAAEKIRRSRQAL